ncbi:50S ribosomal protein L10 [Patescibacteria group bacterium]|nr:50S ribosomal protein L10 [Patescibacteria group bacterium]
MPKTRQQKEQEVKKMIDELKNSKAVVFTTFDGLNVENNQELRNKLRNERVTYQVSKKTLLKMALKDFEVEGLDIDRLKGSVGVAASADDEVIAAKILANFAKVHEQLTIDGGILEGRYIGKEKVIELSKLPSKLELIAKTVATINAPISGFVNVLAGNLRGLVNVLSAIKDNH